MRMTWHIETSAKTNISVLAVFFPMILIQNRQQNSSHPEAYILKSECFFELYSDVQIFL